MPAAVVLGGYRGTIRHGDKSRTIRVEPRALLTGFIRIVLVELQVFRVIIERSAALVVQRFGKYYLCQLVAFERILPNLGHRGGNHHRSQPVVPERPFPNCLDAVRNNQVPAAVVLGGYRGTVRHGDKSRTIRVEPRALFTGFIRIVLVELQVLRVIIERSAAVIVQLFGKYYLCQLVVPERILPNFGHRMGNLQRSQQVVAERSVPNRFDAVSNGHRSQLVFPEGPVLDRGDRGMNNELFGDAPPVGLRGDG